MSRFIVYGTDTGVGKTVVTAALATLAQNAGRTVRVLKPMQTGAEVDDDAAEVDRLVGGAVAEAGWRFDKQLAPSVAARLQGVSIEPEELISWIHARMNTDSTVLETAGGCAVQINDSFDMSDLGAELAWPALVVTRAGLGTLNHTRLTVEYMRQHGVSVQGLIISGLPAEPDFSELTNPAELERVCGAPLLGALPKLDLDRGTALAASFLEDARAGLGPALGGEWQRERYLEAMESALKAGA